MGEYYSHRIKFTWGTPATFSENFNVGNINRQSQNEGVKILLRHPLI
jgi:hypothetical protein